MLHPPDETEAALKARRRYLDFYSITRLHALTLYRAGTPHPDLWQVFQLITGKLGADTGSPELALPALASFLWTPAQSTPDLLDSQLTNRHFLEAVHALAFVRDGNVRRGVDYKNLGSEELGSVYEGLLELHPRINADSGAFELETAAGNERKTSGSYYTPDSLVQCLLESRTGAGRCRAIEKGEDASGEGSRAPQPQGLRPRRWLRPLPHPRSPPHRTSPRQRARGRRGARSRRLSRRPARSHQPLPLRRDLSSKKRVGL